MFCNTSDHNYMGQPNRSHKQTNSTAGQLEELVTHILAESARKYART